MRSLLHIIAFGTICFGSVLLGIDASALAEACLLYTSDAADE